LPHRGRSADLLHERGSSPKRFGAWAMGGAFQFPLHRRS
jgi:hypothetical protein